MRLDGCFLILAGGAALLMETMGHFLGVANLLFWNSFVFQDLVPVGIVTTALHGVFVVAHGACLRAGARGV